MQILFYDFRDMRYTTLTSSLFIRILGGMENRLLEIVEKLAEKRYREGLLPVDRAAIEGEFVDMGYSTEEFGKAMDWAENNLSSPPNKSVRILSAYEKMHLTTSGYGALTKLRNLGLLTDEHLELIIARSILVGEGPIDAEGIRSIATVFLFDLRSGGSGFSIYLDSEIGLIEN